MNRPALLSVLLGAACALSADAAVPETVGFNAHIRPILSNNCFFCHGPDEKKRDGKLRLDLREEALADHDGVRAIVPGKPDESELLARILSHDKDELMPPPKSKRPPLTAEQIATLAQVDRAGREVRGALGLSAAENRATAGGEGERVGAESDRPIHPRAARARGDRALAGGGSRDAHPARVARSDRPPADAGGSRGVRRRCRARCL